MSLADQIFKKYDAEKVVMAKFGGIHMISAGFGVFAFRHKDGGLLITTEEKVLHTLEGDEEDKMFQLVAQAIFKREEE